MLTAIDADIVKTYVGLGLGSGIRKNAWLCGYAYTFIELFAAAPDAQDGHGGTGGS